MVPSFPQPGQRPCHVLGALALGLGWGTTVAALSAGDTVAMLSWAPQSQDSVRAAPWRDSLGQKPASI